MNIDGFQIGIAEDVSQRERRTFVAPSSSWWVGLDREAFSRRVSLEATRMRLGTSQVGTMASMFYGPQTAGALEEAKERRRKREAKL